jgi:signal transduction histidine kinase
VSEILRNVTDSFEEEARQKGLELALRLPETLPPVSGDPRLMERALNNLVNNAIKYTSEGSVVLSAQEENGHLTCTVGDTGMGIEIGDQERIFERFFRADPSRSEETGGTGLGLSIVKRVALAHGGNVHLKSRPGKGSTFTISIPT